MSGAGINLLATFREAVAEDLHGLLFLHDVELTADTVGDLKRVDFPDNLGLNLVGRGGVEGVALMRQAVDGLPAEPDQAVLDDLAADFAAIYLNHAYRASPCESVWLHEENLAWQEPMFQVAEWYRRHGLQAGDRRRRADDHVVLQLLFIAHLMENGDESGLRDAALFLDEHLLRWLPLFCGRVASRCATPFYGALALLTVLYIETLRDILAELLDEPRPSREEVESRMSRAPEPAPEVFGCTPEAGPGW